MSTDLSNRWLRWTIDPTAGRWSFSPLLSSGPDIKYASMGVSWTSGLARGIWPSILSNAELEPLPYDHVLGHPVQGLRLHCRSEQQPLQVEFDFAVLADRPLLLSRMRTRLIGEQSLRLNKLGFLSAGLTNPKGKKQPWEPRTPDVQDSGLRISGNRELVRFFTNGWQSWSYAGSLGVADQQPKTRLGLLSRPIFCNPTTGRSASAGHFVADMFGVVIDPEERSGLLAGFISQKQAFGSLEVNLESSSPGLRMWASGDGYLLEPGDVFETDWAVLGALSLEDSEPLGAYLDLCAEAGHARVPKTAPTGWSSWYYFFESIDRAAFDHNLDWLERHHDSLPMDLVQLDDGFEANVGDWFRFDHRFEGGVKPISRRIADAGMEAGIWLAPYIAKPRSKWVRDHPEWVLRRAGGRPANAGYNWSSFTVGLDPTHPGVEAAVTDLIDTAVNNWGFTFLKLDFLYAAALPGRRYDQATTRAQAMTKALATIRQAAGEQVWLMGCGCPLGSGIGVFDSMRVGPDVAPRWKPAFQGIELFFQHEPGLPSARNGLQVALNRAMLNRKWWINDPDCLIMRDTDSHLSRDEVQTMASLMALLAGSLIDSDDLPSMSAERSTWLGRLLPPLPRQARVHGQFEQEVPELLTLDLSGPVGVWKVVLLINWSPGTRRIPLEPERIGMDASAPWFGVDFWREEPVMVEGPAWSFEVPSHGVRLFSLRRRHDSTPMWLGDTLHISQGLVVEEWKTSNTDLQARLSPGHQMYGRIWLALPSQPAEASLDGDPVEFRPAARGIFAADVAVGAGAHLHVRWGRDRNEGAA